ncbi:MAG: tRNA (cytidine(34)-2'-O)-methyltransferase [Phycisphaerales bacterium]|nr:tRNA (cytidine(34)-2'-O)-methyltransferase [Phycisphaerales bacterium]
MDGAESIGQGIAGGRAALDRALLHVVLHEPEIPNNTGNIGRTCVALASALHLIEPLGFDISEKACRRAGLDYWPRLALATHADWAAYRGATPGVRRWLFTARAGRSIFDAEIRVGDHLVFGKESVGLPNEVLDEAGTPSARGGSDETRLVCLPMVEGERSLNVATAVCAAMYEAIRQMAARGEARIEPGPRGIVLRPPGALPNAHPGGPAGPF